MAGLDGKAEIRKVSDMRACFSEAAYVDTDMDIEPTDMPTLKPHYP